MTKVKTGFYSSEPNYTIMFIGAPSKGNYQKDNKEFVEARFTDLGKLFKADTVILVNYAMKAEFKLSSDEIIQNTLKSTSSFVTFFRNSFGSIDRRICILSLSQIKKDVSTWNMVIPAIKPLSSTENVINKILDLDISHTIKNFNADIFFDSQKPSIKFVIPQLVINEASRLEEYFNSMRNNNVVLDHLQISLAAKNADLPIVSKFGSPEYLYIIRDFYYDEILDQMNETEKSFFLRAMKDRIYVINDTAYSPRNHKAIRFGIIPANTLYGVSENEVMESMSKDNIITVFNGILKRFSEKLYRKEKKILVDEIYPSIHKFQKEQANFLLEKFEKCMRIAKILHERGWQISSFIGRNLDHEVFWKEYYPFVQLTKFETISHKDYLNLLKFNTFYFSHYLETYGIPYFEAIQSGIPVIAFDDYCPMYVFQNMHNSVLFSSQVSDKIAADLIEDYYEKFDENLFHQIRHRANSLFAADDFATRLLTAFKNKGIIE